MMMTSNVAAAPSKTGNSRDSSLSTPFSSFSTGMTTEISGWTGIPA
jgi:hypothetical protein